MTENLIDNRSGAGGTMEGKGTPLENAPHGRRVSIPGLFPVTIALFTAIVYGVTWILGLPDGPAHFLIGAYILGGLVSMFLLGDRLNRLAIDRGFTLFVFVCVAALATGLLLYFLRQPEIRITSPRDGEIVPLGTGKMIIVGVAKKLRPQSHVWLILYGPTRVFIPQTEVIPDQSGKWDGEVNLWAANCQYDIWAVVAGPAPHEWFATNREFTVWSPAPKYFSKISVSRLAERPSGE